MEDSEESVMGVIVETVKISEGEKTENRKTKQVGKVMCSQSVFMCLHATTASISVIIKKDDTSKAILPAILYFIFSDINTNFLKLPKTYHHAVY